MKIAIPSTDNDLESFTCDTLGRAPFIIIYDIESKKYNCITNSGFVVRDGAGLKASKIILENNADVLLTRKIGSKAYSVLMKEHIDIHLLSSDGTVKSAINKFLKK